jgi:uncharacterized OB-fold protein
VLHDHAGASTAVVRIEPAVTPEMAPFWDAAGHGRFAVQQCTQCGHHLFPPRGICRSCRSFELEFVDAPLAGVLYSFTVNHQAWLPDVGVFGLGLADFPATPGVRLLARLSSDFDLSALEVGLPVRLAFGRSASGPPIPYLLPGPHAGRAE